MKKIGILGGMSIHSTLKYMEWLSHGIQQRLGGVHSPEMLVDCVDFDLVKGYQESGSWKAIVTMMISRARKLQASGADFIVLATNTVHIVAGEIENAISVPFLHIADATAQAIKDKNVKTVGLIGTGYTMNMDFYRGRLEKAGLTCLVPETEDERNHIHAIIFNELVKGVVKPESREAFMKAANALLARGAEGIILGCTEVNMLLNESDFNQPVFDTTRIHVDKALEFMLG